MLDDVLNQAGIMRVDAIKKLTDMARAFELPPMRGNRIAVVSQAGGYAVMLSDEAYKRGFEFPGLTDDLVQDFKEHVRGDVIRLGNPLDLGDILSSDAIAYTIDRLLSRDYIDGVAVVLMRRADTQYNGAYSGLSREVYPDIGELMKKHKKPVALCLLSLCHYLRHVQNRMDYPIFENPEDAIEALQVSRDYYRRRPAG